VRPDRQRLAFITPTGGSAARGWITSSPSIAGCWILRAVSAPPSTWRGYTDFRLTTQQQLDDVAGELNDRPRQTLAWQTPRHTLTAFVATLPPWYREVRQIDADLIIEIVQFNSAFGVSDEQRGRRRPGLLRRSDPSDMADHLRPIPALAPGDTTKTGGSITGLILDSGEKNTMCSW